MLPKLAVFLREDIGILNWLQERKGILRSSCSQLTDDYYCSYYYWTSIVCVCVSFTSFFGVAHGGKSTQTKQWIVSLLLLLALPENVRRLNLCDQSVRVCMSKVQQIEVSKQH